MDPELGRGGPLGVPPPSSGGPLATPPPSDGADASMASMTSQPAATGAGEGTGAWTPGLDINDPNVWHRAGGQWSEANRAADTQGIMNDIGNRFGGTSGPEQKSSPMTPEAQRVMNTLKFPVDPNRIVYGGGTTGKGGFTLDSVNGPDLFGDKLQGAGGYFPMGGIPKELQPLLAPALVRYYQDNDYQGGAAHGQQSAPWSRFFAPPGPSPNNHQFEHTWPGITQIDPWGREMGEYRALYS